jgi:hypothetical protein
MQLINVNSAYFVLWQQDLNSSAWYMFAAVTRAFAVYLDIVCLMYVTCVMLSFLIMSEGELNISLCLLMCTKGMEDLVFLNLLYLLT